jgi:hypothetical protein
MFSVSANNPYAFQNQFVGDSLSKGYEDEKSKRDEEFKVLQEERRLREEKLKDLSRLYIDQFPPGADVSDASKELGSIITQEMTKYRNDYGQLAIGYPKADVGSEQSGTIKAGMDEVISNANSLNNQVASWTEMKKDILEKASTNDYTNQFSKDSKNQEVAEELLEVFTGGVKAEIKDGKIGYESKQQGKFVTVKEMQRMLPFGKANDYAENFLKIRQQVVTGEISKDALDAFTQPLRTNLDGEEGLKTALSLAADDILLPGTALMGQTAIDDDGTEVESGFAYDFDGDRNLDLIETKMLMDAVYRGDKKAEKILKDEVYRRLNKSLNGDADKYQTKLNLAATAKANLNNDGEAEVDDNLKAIQNRVRVAFSSVGADQKTLKQSDFKVVATELNRQLKGTGYTVKYRLDGINPMIQFLDEEGQKIFPVKGFGNMSKVPFNPVNIVNVLSNLNVKMKDIPGMKESNYEIEDISYGLPENSLFPGAFVNPLTFPEEKK